MRRRRGGPPRPGLDDIRYKKNRDILKQIGNHICNWCGHPIDMQLTYPHPASWSCDHLIPRSQLHPLDDRHWRIEYLAEAHRRCNSARGAKPTPRPIQHGINTSIDW